MSLDPTIVQQLPTGAEDAIDVGTVVFDHLVQQNFNEIAADHEARIVFGEKKYGQRLKINNGRNAAFDSYQELLDFLSYAMQAHLEGQEGFLDLFYQVAEVAAVVRGRL
jgi:hypothetical protein